MRFDLIDLRLCLHIRETGSITAGAARVHLTLSSASERIRKLEANLGAALMTRQRRGVQFTPAGLTLVHHARQVLRNIDHLEDELAQYGRGIRGHIRMACNTSALSEHLPAILATFLTNHPLVSVDIEEKLSLDIVDAVRDGQWELGIAANSADLSGVTSEFFCKDPLAVVVARDHPLARHGTVALTQVAHLEFIGLVGPNALEDHVARHVRRIGRYLSYRLKVRSLDEVCRMAGRGLGVAIVPLAAAKRCKRTAGIVALPLLDPWATRDLMLCFRTEDALSLHAKEMVKTIRRHYGERYST